MCFLISLILGDWSDDGITQENNTYRHKVLDLTFNSPCSSKSWKSNDDNFYFHTVCLI